MSDMDINKKNLSKVFSDIAPKYDLLNRILSFNLDKSWRKELVDISYKGENKNILDLCCGTADISIEFAKNHISSRVFGVDFSGEMLKLAREKINALGLQGYIYLIEADVLSLPFKPGTFDVVSMGFGLRNLLDYQQGVNEIANMLKPGGQAIILEFSPPERSAFGWVYKFYLKKILPGVVQMFGSSQSAYSYLCSSIEDFLHPDQILSCMKSAGLRNLYFKKMSAGIVNLYSGKK